MLTSSSAQFLLLVEKMDSKERVISEVYYNVRTGFGSIAETLKPAKRKDPRITRNDVTKFLNKQDINQKRKTNRYNSFVPPFPREQHQIDLADFGGGDDFRYAFVCVDVFTKMLAVAPLKRNSVRKLRALLR